MTRVFRFVVLVGEVKNVVQSFVQLNCDRRKAEIIRKNILVLQRDLKAEESDNLEDTRKQKNQHPLTEHSTKDLFKDVKPQDINHCACCGCLVFPSFRKFGEYFSFRLRF